MGEEECFARKGETGGFAAKLHARGATARVRVIRLGVGISKRSNLAGTIRRRPTIDFSEIG